MVFEIVYMVITSVVATAAFFHTVLKGRSDSKKLEKQNLHVHEILDKLTAISQSYENEVKELMKKVDRLEKKISSVKRTGTKSSRRTSDERKRKDEIEARKVAIRERKQNMKEVLEIGKLLGVVKK